MRIGPRGATLSGELARRTAARVLVCAPALLVFDDREASMHCLRGSEEFRRLWHAEDEAGVQ